MTVLLYIISIIWVAVGVFLVLYTERTKEVSKKLFPTDKLKGWAVVPLLFGVGLVLGAFFQRRMFWLALILGFLALSKGVYLIVGPSAQVRKVMDWWFEKASDRTLRLFGLIIFLLGGAIFSYL